MNYTLQLHGERMLYPMPPGLYELMSDISREVLRDQPSIVYKYIADYLDTLVKVREYSRTATHLVNDIIDENRELLAYADSLGVSWHEVNIAATKIQAAFRRYIKIREMKLNSKAIAEAERIKTLSLTSQSFQEFLKTLDVGIEEASKASALIQAAYRTFLTKKQLKEEHTKTSTHTIDAIIPKPAPVVTIETKKPFKRDSKLLVYEQTPRHSVESSWSTRKRQITEEEAKCTQTVVEPAFKLVYEHPSPTSLTIAKSKDSSSRSTVREERFTLPSYYDENQPGVPMISETGQLVKDDNDDIVTLYSTNTVDEDMLDGSESLIKLTSTSNVSLMPKPVKSKELFDAIEHRSSKITKFIHSKDPLDEETRGDIEASINKELSKLSIDSESIKTIDLIKHSGRIMSSGTPKTSTTKAQIASGKSSKYKVDFIKENLDES